MIPSCSRGQALLCGVDSSGWIGAVFGQVREPSDRPSDVAACLVWRVFGRGEGGEWTCVGRDVRVLWPC